MKKPDDSAHAAGSAISRRDLLLSSASGIAAGAVIGGLAGCSPGAAQQSSAASSQSPIRGSRVLLKGGCVLSLDRSVGDFEKADVLIDGSKITAVRPNI